MFIVSFLLRSFAQFINATTEEDLDKAGQHLASFVSTVGINILVALLTKKAATKIKDGVSSRGGVENNNRLPGNNGGAVTRTGSGQIEPRGSNNNTTTPPVVAPQLPSISETETVENETESSNRNNNKIVGVDEAVLTNLEQQYPNNLFESNGNLVEINNQIDIHPLKIAETNADTMILIVESTKELDGVGGDITKVSPETRKTIEDLTKTGGGRWRFEYQKNAVVNQYLEYVGLEDNELFQNMSDAEKIRLFDVPNQMQYLDEVPENARKRARKLEAKQQEKTIEQQAASYAIQQNPQNANEFVNYVEFYKAQMEQRIKDLEEQYDKKLEAAVVDLAAKEGIEPNIKTFTQKQKVKVNRQASGEFSRELYGEKTQFEGKNPIKKYIK